MNQNAGMVDTTVKLSFKRHIMPPIVGVFIVLSFLGVSNSQLIAAKMHAMTFQQPAAAAAPSDTGADEDAPPAVDPSLPSNITIDNIGVDAPVIYGLQTIDEGAFQQALQRGVVHYPGTALPGNAGNVVVFGHSSGQVWAPGDYKFVFTHLEKLRENDIVSLSHEGIRYSYRITGTKVVPPTDVSVLTPTENHTLTLITCTPVGTNKSRLIVTAEQINPAPVQPAEETTNTAPINPPQLPGSSDSSIWQSISSLF